MKKQLESSNHNLKVAQEEHVRQLHALQTALISHGHPVRSRSNSPSHSPQAAARASTTTRSSNVFSSTSSTANTGELMELLAREQQRARDMQQKIHSLQEEKNTMN